MLPVETLFYVVPVAPSPPPLETAYKIARLGAQCDQNHAVIDSDLECATAAAVLHRSQPDVGVPDGFGRVVTSEIGPGYPAATSLPHGCFWNTSSRAVYFNPAGVLRDYPAGSLLRLLCGA